MSKDFNLDPLDNIFGEASDVISIRTDETIQPEDLEQIKNRLPILPLRNTVLFPNVVFPIYIGRKKSIRMIRSINKKTKFLGTVGQKSDETGDPKFNDIYKVGTIAKIIKILELPDGAISVILQGMKRFEIVEPISEDPYLLASIEKLNDIKPADDDKEFEAIISSLKDLSSRILQLSDNIPPEAVFAVKNIDNPVFLINLICSNSDLGVERKQHLIEISDLKYRGIKLLEYLSEEVQKLELKGDIQQKTHQEMDKQQREYFLNQQIKTIQKELGEGPGESDVAKLKELASKKRWNKTVEDTFNKELGRLQRINPASPDYSVHLNYLQTLVDLPWNEFTKDNFDLKRAQRILDEDHAGIDNVKERILEYLAVLKMKGDLKSPIICLYGPPGVGKTSLGKSIARALNRKYVRMSLGGLHDEAEIRGHRKTYIGALPGRIMQNLKKVKSANPVFILDEIDKVGSDFKGDPSSALLEVLDPEQNSTFYDNYLELDFDLSKVMFIATANSTSTIKPALLDRMELIHVSGYLLEEKIEIAKKHLVPKQIKDHGLKMSQLKFDDKILEQLIDNYTRESGVRELDKKIAKVVRQVVKKIAFAEKYNVKITATDLENYLGIPKFVKDKYQGNQYAGVVTGLAWTALGGEILFIESSLSKGNGKLTLTGNLGSVMKESAVIALEFLKGHADMINLNPEVFDNWNLHIHVPEGAIPKDGPSAGITMLTSVASVFTQRKVKPFLAMTGEITLRGKVLPVGGIKEKILAAKRAGIKEIILSDENKKDVEEIKEIYREGLIFHYTENVQDVLKIALLDEKVDNAKNLTIKKKVKKKTT